MVGNFSSTINQKWTPTKKNIATIFHACLAQAHRGFIFISNSFLYTLNVFERITRCAGPFTFSMFSQAEFASYLSFKSCNCLVVENTLIWFPRKYFPVKRFFTLKYFARKSMHLNPKCFLKIFVHNFLWNSHSQRIHRH